MLVLALLILLVVALTLIAAYFYGNGEASYFSIEKDEEDLTSLEAGFVITATVLFLFILFVLLVKLW